MFNSGVALSAQISGLPQQKQQYARLFAISLTSINAPNLSLRLSFPSNHHGLLWQLCFQI
jgi:hypothetical protein